MQEPENTLIQIDYPTLKAIDTYLETFYETHYATGKKHNIGQMMFDNKLGSTQVRGLERLAFSSTRFSQIINYVKNQAGKEKKKQWSVVAHELIGQLETLENKAHDLGKNHPALVLDIKMKLARGLIKMIVASYYYQSKQDKESQ
jgi:hypothetical protein